MDIREITDPAFIKQLNPKEREQLAYDIREFLITHVTKTGGHLASNLGIVELTIALHTVFDIGTDTILFDIGHQSYVHKILCGSASQFSSLRQYNGLSGYQKRHESVFDPVEAHHPGSALSLALGYQEARNYQGRMIVVLGDGALTNGTTFEALQAIATRHQSLIIIINDNSQSARASSFSQVIDRVRVTKTYVATKKEVSNLLYDSMIGRPLYHGLKKFHDVLKDTMLHSSIFNELGLEYLGPVDGHSIETLNAYLRKAIEVEGPVVLHVKTILGKGHKSKAPIFLDMNTEIPKDLEDIAQGVAQTITDLAALNDKINVFAMNDHNNTTYDSFKRRYPDRYHEMNMAFSHSVLMAAGMAMAGKRPFIEVTSVMVQTVYDQINNDIARLDLPVVIGIKDTGLVGEDGSSFQGVFDYAILRSLPQLAIACGKDEQENRNLLYTAFKQFHPFVLRYPHQFVLKQAPTAYQLCPIGSWVYLHVATNCEGIVLSYGPDVEKLNRKIMVNDLPWTVINARYLKPLDERVLKEIGRLNCPIMVYETDIRAANLGSAMLEFYNDQQLSVRLLRIGIDDHYVGQGSTNQLRKLEHLDLNSVIEQFTAFIHE